MHVLLNLKADWLVLIYFIFKMKMCVAFMASSELEKIILRSCFFCKFRLMIERHS